MRWLPALALLSEKSVEQLTAVETAMLQEQVNGLLMVLRDRTDLVIDKLCLCERIDGYGDYKPVREGHAFQARELVQAYVEVRNIASVLREDRYYVTVLKGSITFQDAQCTRVRIINISNKERELRSIEPRSECMRSVSFNVPPDLPGGTLHVDAGNHRRNAATSPRCQKIGGVRGGAAGALVEGWSPAFRRKDPAKAGTPTWRKDPAKAGTPT